MTNVPDRQTGYGAGNFNPNGAESAPRREPGDDGRELLERLMDGVHRRRWLVLGIVLVVVASVATYNFTAEPEYEAASLILLDLQSEWSRIQQDKAASGDYFAENDRTLSGELFVIQASGRISERVQERMGAAVGVANVGRTSGASVRFHPADEQINAIRVLAASSDPEEAALLANLYAEEYVRLTKEAGRASVSISRQQLEEQEKTYQAQLQSIEKEIEQYLEAHGAAGLDQSSSFIVSQIGNLEAQRDDAQIQLRQRAASLESLQSEIRNINPTIVRQLSSGSDATIQAYQQQIAKLEIDRDAIRMNHPDSQDPAVQARLERINGQLDRLRSEIQTRSEQYVEDVLQNGGLGADNSGVSTVARLSQDALTDRIAIQGLEAQLDIVQNRLADYERQLAAIPGQSTDLAQLRRKQQHAEQMYELVVQRLQRMTVEDESNPGYARVLREASVPAAPARPRHARNLTLAAIFGLLLGCAVAAVSERFDNRIYKPDEILERGNLVLGVIPDMQPLLEEDYDGSEVIERNGRQLASNLVMLHSPTSAVAEAYRQARTNVLFGRNGAKVKTLLVTGPGMTDGKTVSACNLAISLAQAGHKTLLIDADLRRPVLHKRFDVPDKPGLVGALRTNEVEAVRTDVDNLFVLPSGSSNGKDVQDDPSNNAAEILGSKAMNALLEKLKREYDVIVLDSPPILAATDAVVLSTQCDATLLVIRAGKTRESEMKYALKSLADVQAPVIGALLNGFSLTMAYGYSYRYPGYTRYGMYSKYGYNGHAEDDAEMEVNPVAWARSSVEIVNKAIDKRTERNGNAI